MRKLLPLPLLLILGLAACQNNKDVITQPEEVYTALEPLLLHTSLQDTVPAKTMKALGLTKVNGLKVKYPTGKYASYFEYTADPKDVIREIGHLPFPRYAHAADTLCRQIDFTALDLIRERSTATEQDVCSYFWDVRKEDYDIYECLKGSFLHTLLIAKHSKSIIHRVEFLG